MRWWLMGMLVAVAAGCGDDGSVDGSEDASVSPDAAELPDPPTFEVTPDPDVPTGCLATPPAAGEVRAKVIDCEDELIEGSLAMGRVGDIVLANDRFSVIVRTGEESATLIGAHAGGIVDGARHGEPDLLKEVFMALDLATARPSAIVITEGGASGVARVEVPFELRRLELIAATLGGIGRTPPGFGVLAYELRPDEDVLRIEMRVAATEGEARLVGRPAMVVTVGGAGEVQMPGVGVLDDDRLSGNAADAAGFGGVVVESPRTAFGARLYAEDIGVSRILTILLFQSGERLVVPAGEIGTHAGALSFAPDAASAHALLVTDDEPLQSVQVEGPARVSVAVDGEPWLRTRAGEAGTTLRLPAGARSYTPGFGPFFEAEVVADDGAAVTLPPAPSATLRVDSTAEGVAMPIRATALREGEEILRAVALGPTDFTLPPGPAELTLSRGYEYDRHDQSLTFVDGETLTVSADLPRVVDTTGWVAGDFHLHTELSTDSTHAVPDAVRIVAGEGLEVVASTDHDFIADYGPALAEAELDAFVLAVPGVEASDPILAHVGGYPLRRDPERAGYGAPIWFGSNPTVLFDEVRAQGDESLGGAFVQINHPFKDNSGWFKAIDLDPLTGMVGTTPMDLNLPADTDLSEFDWDVVEVWNDGAGSDNEETFATYLGLWANGWRFAMVGNSDTHHPGRAAGTTRTLVRVPDDTLGAFDWSDVAASFRAGDLSVSGGAFVEAEVVGAAGDTASVQVRVQAPPFIEVDRLRVYAGTEVAVDRPIPATSEVVRLDEVVDVPLGGATFVVVRVDGPRSAPPVLPFPAFGLSNPLLVE